MLIYLQPIDWAGARWGELRGAKECYVKTLKLNPFSNCLVNPKLKPMWKKEEDK